MLDQSCHSRIKDLNSCVRTYSELYTVPEVLEKFNAKQLEEFGLDTNYFAKAFASQTCTSQKAIVKQMTVNITQKTVGYLHLLLGVVLKNNFMSLENLPK
tara:strand:- start:3229 stop:3528 length:300 start_codon:yes stop_codon:yes gene_type:complete